MTNVASQLGHLGFQANRLRHVCHPCWSHFQCSAECVICVPRAVVANKEYALHLVLKEVYTVLSVA